MGPGAAGPTPARVAVTQALAADSAALPVVVIGSFDAVSNRAGCPYDLSLTWPRRAQLNLVPPTVSGTTPRVIRTGDRSFTAHADADGFAIASRRGPPPVGAQFSPGGIRIRPVSPPLVSEGHQRVGDARIDVIEANGAVIRTLGYTLDKPLEHYAFIAVDGCTKVRAYRPQ